MTAGLCQARIKFKYTHKLTVWVRLYCDFQKQKKINNNKLKEKLIIECHNVNSLWILTETFLFSFLKSEIIGEKNETDEYPY